VNMLARGFSVLRELYATGDHLLTSADFAFQHLRIWCDFDRDAVSQTYELLSFAQLGITQVDFVAGTYARNGQTLSLTLTDLTATSAGFLVRAAENAALIISETGTSSLQTFAVQDLPNVNLGSLSADGQLLVRGEALDGFEDTVVKVSASQLLNNDTSIGNEALSIVGVSNAINGTVELNALTGVVSFTPTANYFGEARFWTCPELTDTLLC
jgi:Cadherin-like domain